MIIINETKYNNKTINEASKLLTVKYKTIIGGAVAILVAMMCYYGLAGSLNVAIIPAVGIVVIILTGALRIAGYKKMLLQRLQVLNQQSEVVCNYEIDDDKIVVTSPNGTNTLFHKDIKKIHETKNIYLIIYLGGVFSIISKTGFKNNDENEFRKIVSLD